MMEALAPPKDWNDAHRLGINARENADRVWSAPQLTIPPIAGADSHVPIGALDYEAFLARQIPPRRCLLSPWLPEAGLGMLHAPRGLGKTHVALGTAWAVSNGTGFLRWKVPDDVGARRVVAIDGEMPGALLQERLRSIIGASEFRPPMPDYLKIVAADLRRDGLPDLADPSAQQFYADIVADADLVIVDNLSTLCRSLKENEADSWTPIQNWLLAQRRAGKSVLVIHHGGKSGTQRGTSRKEDVLDTVISLRKPPDYQAVQGARFEIHFEKARGFHGPDAEPFEARFDGVNWQLSAIRSGDDDETLRALRKQGLSVRDPTEPASPNPLFSAGSKGATMTFERLSHGTFPRRVPWDSAADGRTFGTLGHLGRWDRWDMETGNER